MARHYTHGGQLLICLVGILAIDSVSCSQSVQQCQQSHGADIDNYRNSSTVYFCGLIEQFAKCVIQAPELRDRHDLADVVRPLINNMDRGVRCTPWQIRQWIVDVLPGNRIWGLSGTFTDRQYKAYYHCRMDVQYCSDIEEEMVCSLRALDLEYMLPNNVHYDEVSFLLNERTRAIGSQYRCYFQLEELLKRAQANSSSKNYVSIMSVLALILSAAMLHW